MDFAKDEKIMKNWKSNTKESQDKFETEIIITNKRLISILKEETSETIKYTSQEVMIENIKGITCKHSKSKSSISIGLFLALIFLIVGIVMILFNANFGGVFIIIAAVIFILSCFGQKSIEKYCVTVHTNFTGSTIVCQKETQNTDMEIPVASTALREIMDTIGSIILTVQNKC